MKSESPDGKRMRISSLRRERGRIEYVELLRRDESGWYVAGQKTRDDRLIAGVVFGRGSGTGAC